MRILAEGSTPIDGEEPSGMRYAVLALEDNDWLDPDFFVPDPLSVTEDEWAEAEERIEEEYRRMAMKKATMHHFYRGPGQPYGNEPTMHMDYAIIFLSQKVGLDV